ncbi:hypothetical protein MHYP_G00065250 [Metynnis hypsauchen]
MTFSSAPDSISRVSPENTQRWVSGQICSAHASSDWVLLSRLNTQQDKQTQPSFPNTAHATPRPTLGLTPLRCLVSVYLDRYLTLISTRIAGNPWSDHTKQYRATCSQFLDTLSKPMGTSTYENKPQLSNSKSLDSPLHNPSPPVFPLRPPSLLYISFSRYCTSSHIHQWNLSPCPVRKHVSMKDRQAGDLDVPQAGQRRTKNGGGVPDWCTLSVLEMSSVRFASQAQSPVGGAARPWSQAQPKMKRMERAE